MTMNEWRTQNKVFNACKNSITKNLKSAYNYKAMNKLVSLTADNFGEDTLKMLVAHTARYQPNIFSDETLQWADNIPPIPQPPESPGYILSYDNLVVEAHKLVLNKLCDETRTANFTKEKKCEKEEGFDFG